MSLTLNALESTPLDPMTHEEGVRFPEGALPRQSPIYTRNSLVIAAAPERLFAWLLAAPRWPEWYANAKDVAHRRRRATADARSRVHLGHLRCPRAYARRRARAGTPPRMERTRPRLDRLPRLAARSGSRGHARHDRRDPARPRRQPRPRGAAARAFEMAPAVARGPRPGSRRRACPRSDLEEIDTQPAPEPAPRAAASSRHTRSLTSPTNPPAHLRDFRKIYGLFPGLFEDILRNRSCTRYGKAAAW